MVKAFILALMAFVIICLIVIDSEITKMKLEEEVELEKKKLPKAVVVTPCIDDNLTYEDINPDESTIRQIKSDVSRMLKAEKVRRKWRRAACR